MHFDFTGAELFCAYLNGKATPGQVFDHPAYRAMRRHASLFSEGISEQDVEDACQGKPSPFYGLDGLSARLPRIDAFLEFLRANADAWSAAAQATLAELFPREALAITVYPIIGYDMGIGLDGAVCLNCNYERYLAEPEEFLFYVVHECVHVIYERHHDIPPLSEVVSAAQWRSYFNLWVQNEGYAVYAPLKLRQRSGRLDERDYKVLFDPGEIETHRIAFLETLGQLQVDQPLTVDTYLDLCFGPRRLTYRIGCECIRRIEIAGGLAAVREAFYWDGNTFIDTYRRLLET